MPDPITWPTVVLEIAKLSASGIIAGLTAFFTAKRAGENGINLAREAYNIEMRKSQEIARREKAEELVKRFLSIHRIALHHCVTLNCWLRSSQDMEDVEGIAKDDDLISNTYEIEGMAALLELYGFKEAARLMNEYFMHHGRIPLYADSGISDTRHNAAILSVTRDQIIKELNSVFAPSTPPAPPPASRDSVEG